jgi:hypothetical protein
MYILTHTQLASERPEREASAQLTAVSQVNGDSKSSNERGPFLVGSLGFSCRYKRFYPGFGCSTQPSKKKFPHRTLFYFICPHYPSPSKPGQAVVQDRLSLKEFLR